MRAINEKDFFAELTPEDLYEMNRPLTREERMQQAREARLNTPDSVIHELYHTE